MGNGKLIPGLILAAGGVVIRGNQTLIVFHERRGEWTLPRGKLKRGETPLGAALRETEEETGYAVTPAGFAGCISYLVEGVPKVVLFWRMSAKGPPGEIDATEIAEARWVTLAGARKMLSHSAEFRLLHRAWRGPGAPDPDLPTKTVPFPRDPDD